MPTVRPSGAGDEAVGTGEKVNGGTVINAGSNAAGIITKNLSLADVADDFGESFGSKIVANDGTGAATTDRAGVQEALAGGSGTLAYNSTASQWIMQGGNVTSKISNLSTNPVGGSNDLMAGGAADSDGMNATRSSVTSNNNRKKIGVTDIDIYARPSTTINGFVTRTNAGDDVNLVAPSGAGNVAASDDAASPTRSVPGELTYMFGGKNPQTDEYAPKDSGVR